MEGLPLRLLIVFTVLSLSMPVLMDSLSSHQAEVDRARIDSFCRELREAAYRCYLRGLGDRVELVADLPPGGSVTIGGEGVDGYSIRPSYRGEALPRVFMGDPPLRIACGEMELEGRCDLLIGCVEVGGERAMEVTPR